jgi:hypothetical protein
MQYFHAITALLVILTQLLQVVESERANTDIDLHTADLRYDYQNSKIYAHGRFSNKAIINEKERSKYGQLEWFSYGVPRLVYQKRNYLKNKDEAILDNCSLFRMNGRGFTILVDMLT